MRENLGKKPDLQRDSVEAFMYDEPIKLRCISNRRYEHNNSKEVGSLINGENYYALGEVRDHFILGVPGLLIEDGPSKKTTMSETVRLECVAPKCRFEVIDDKDGDAN